MKLFKILSFVGIIFNLLAHLVSWTTPNLLHFAVVGVPLHVVSMLILYRLYRDRALPLQKNADKSWLRHASSGVHALIFLSILSLMFHTIVAVLGLSMFVMFLIRALSSIWLLTYAMGYGYASWAGHNQFKLNQLRLNGRHRSRIQQKADSIKSDIHVNIPETLRQKC